MGFCRSVLLLAASTPTLFIFIIQEVLRCAAPTPVKIINRLVACGLSPWLEIKEVSRQFQLLVPKITD